MRVSVPGLYLWTAAIALLGGLAFASTQGLRSGLAFVLGALTSAGSLWTLDRMTGTLAKPGSRPWQAGVFYSRYLLLFAAGYAIVLTLGVSPLPVLAGLLASSMAAVCAALLELLTGHRGP